MQIGIGGAATDNWDTIVAEIPPDLPGGAQPPSVYNETDAVYGAAALLKKWGAPGNWQAALVAWNDYPPEIAQVTQLVAQYTQTAQGTAARPRSHDVDVAGPGGRAGMCAGQRTDDPRRGRPDPAQRAGGDPAGRAAGGAGDDRGR